jgi:hypothetical protein
VILVPLSLQADQRMQMPAVNASKQPKTQ